ncbi:PAS domain-containing protein, partial [Hydrocoleum sp. CS-953]|uniref:PAS domain-containing protein n=1 Tax=Hydrocoleum sp. CS-953 TaxID=1671698 RepID=UPI00117AC0BE
MFDDTADHLQADFAGHLRIVGVRHKGVLTAGAIHEILGHTGQLRRIVTKGLDVVFTTFRNGFAIAERRLLEGILRKTLKELSDIQFSIDQAAIVAITDHRGIIQYVNDKVYEISQYSREELIGKTHRLLNSGYHSHEFFRDLWSTIRSGQVWRGEIKNRAKDGSYYWVNTTIVPFLNDLGQPYQYLAIRFDITERKRVEEALQESQERNHSLLNAIPDLMLRLNS